MKKILFAILVILIASAAYAASSSSFISSPEGFGMSPGSTESSAFYIWTTSGDTAIGEASSGTYNMGAGFVSAYTLTISDVSSPEAPDTTPPKIQNIQFDGRTTVSGDYVTAQPVITATVTDEETGLLLNICSVEVDSVMISFSALSGSSTYDASSGLLTYCPTFSDGTHSFRIHARDTASNYSSSESLSITVQSTGVEIKGAVLNYPNPFNPAIGEETEIGYQLSADANVTVYIFNILGQPIKKIDCPAGTEGGSAGYNKVAWNGYSDFSRIAGNDLYLVRIVSGGKVIGKTKIVVLK